MKKRPKSVSLSDKLLKELDRMLKMERRKALSTSPLPTNDYISFSGMVEKLLWEAIKTRQS